MGWDGIQLESQRGNLCQRESPHFLPLPWIQSKILEMVFAKELHKLHPNCFRGNPCNKASLSSTRQPRQPVLLIGSKYKAEAATKIMMQ